MCTFLQRTLIDLWGMNSLYKTMKNLAWCIIFAYISNNSAILLMSNTGLYPSKIPATHFNNRNHHLLHFHSSGMQVIGCRWETSGCTLQLVVHLFRICISLELSGEKCGPASNSHLTLHAVATQGNLSFHGFAIAKAHSSKTASGAGYSEVILYSYESNWNENCEKARRGKNITCHWRTMSGCSSQRLKPPYLTFYGIPWKALWISRREKQGPVFTTASFPVQLCFFFCLRSPGSKGMNKQKIMVHRHAFLSRMSLHEIKVSVTKAFRHGGFLYIAHI